MKRLWVRTRILLPSRLWEVWTHRGLWARHLSSYTHRRPPERDHHPAFLWARRDVGGEGLTPRLPAHSSTLLSPIHTPPNSAKTSKCLRASSELEEHEPAAKTEPRQTRCGKGFLLLKEETRERMTAHSDTQLLVGPEWQGHDSAYYNQSTFCRIQYCFQWLESRHLGLIWQIAV